jgi:hypothetical protein
MKKISFFVGILIVLTVLVLNSSTYAADFIIDPFNTKQSADATAGDAPVSVGSSILAPFSVGGERDLYVEKTTGGNEDTIKSRINPTGLTFFNMSLDNETRGRVVVTWDGVDGQYLPGQVKYNGLGSLDFTQYSSLDIMLVSSDVGGPVKFTFWDSRFGGTSYATVTFNVPGGINSNVPNTLLSKDFLTDFSATNGNIYDILSHVGAIQMEVDARDQAQESWDLRFDLVKVSGPPISTPEPTTILLIGLGLAGLVVLKKRWN